LPLFRDARRAAPEPSAGSSPLEDMLRETRPDELSPREALEMLYRLKGMVKE
jgi:DNA mismatch repair protein MutS